MLFGLKNVSSTYCQTIDVVFKDKLANFAKVFVYDMNVLCIIGYEHLQDLYQALRRNSIWGNAFWSILKIMMANIELDLIKWKQCYNCLFSLIWFINPMCLDEREFLFWYYYWK
jgi:hypothetical protein